MRLEKCMHSVTRNELKDNTYDKDKVLVYYGFSTYNRTVAHVHKIAMAIKEDFPDMPITEMEVYEITRAQSNRRAGHTMISFYADTKFVKDNLTDFCSL